jgi:hypothetical protein
LRPRAQGQQHPGLRVLGPDPAQQLPVQRRCLWPVDQAVAPALGQVEGVDRQGAEDQVPAGQAGGAQEPLQPLAGLPGQGPATEQVVVGGLVGQDEQAQVAEPAR